MDGSQADCRKGGRIELAVVEVGAQSAKEDLIAEVTVEPRENRGGFGLSCGGEGEEESPAGTRATDELVSETMHG